MYEHVSDQKSFSPSSHFNKHEIGVHRNVETHPDFYFPIFLSQRSKDQSYKRDFVFKKTKLILNSSNNHNTSVDEFDFNS